MNAVVVEKSTAGSLTYLGQDVRTSDDAAHVRWICARDVGACLGMTNRSSVLDAVKRLHHDQRCRIETDTPSGRQSMTFVTLGATRQMALERVHEWTSDASSDPALDLTVKRIHDKRRGVKS